MRNLLAIMCFFGLIAANAQTSVIRGKAIDGTSKKGIEFATVVLLKATDSTLIKGSLTDTIGNFEINYLSAGAYILSISSIEYQKIYKGPLVIDADGQTLDVGMLEMGTDQKLLAEVVVKGEKLPFERYADKVVMNVASSSLFKSSANAIDVLRKAPSIQVKADGSILMQNSITPKVFVDGKDIPMNGAELSNYLNSLNPEMIESIEIITNPSAKYDAQYKGIINIVLKRDKTLGFNGNYTVSYRQNLLGAFNNSLMLNYKTKKFAYTANLSYRNYGSLYFFKANQNLANSNQLFTDSEMKSFSKDLGYQFGIDYSISKKQNIGFLWKGYNNDEDRTTMTNNILQTSEVVSNNLETIQESNPKNANNSVNLFYNSELGKSKLSVLATYADFDNTENQDIQSRSQSQLSEYLKSNLSNRIDIRSIQTDYTVPALKGTLELGLKIANSKTDNDLRFDKFQNQQFVVDTRRTNNFIYQENIKAGYFNYSKESRKLNMQFGLRVENTATEAVSITNKTETVRNYYRWLPSANFNYRLNDEQNINLSFSRRLRRPNYEELNPFQFYVSPYTYAEGNPFLLPTTTSVYSLGYNYKDFGITFNAGTDQDPIRQLPFYDPKTDITAYIRSNIKKNNFANAELNYTFTPNKWWKIQHNGGLYYDNGYIIYNNKEYNQGITYFYLTGSNVFTLPQNFIFDINYNYTSKAGDVLYSTRATYDLNLGLQKAFLNKKLNAKLNFNDIFYSYVPRAVTRQKEILDVSSSQRYATRLVRLQLNYNFGKSTYKSRSKGRTEEENRASK